MRHRACVPYVLVVSLGLTATAIAHGNTRGEAKVSLGGKPIVVDYGRPSLKGRDMLGKAEVGQEWRMGADAPTTLDTPVSLTFGGARVPPGQYVLRAKKVSDKDWVLKLERDGKTAAEVPLRAASSRRASRCSPSTSPRSRARASSACPGATWRWPHASPPSSTSVALCARAHEVSQRTRRGSRGPRCMRRS